MNKTQREAALRYAGILEREARDHGSTDYKHYVAALLRELLAEPVINHKMTTEPAEPQGEPVAWFYRSISGAQFVHFYKNTPRFLADQDAAEQWPDAHSLTPLYIHPPQQRKPLTYRQAIALWADRSDGPANHEIISFARAIERAHGIVEAP